ncbi:succinate dehydrogenase / fumarate reductase cytochrome b subunit [Amycolatopsis xylanica]|uniref:Succinate dehydrogenase / fumarate reductase cytochrome b subunit n=1 Tax=Amycolatopsis xylanica TaxID=589385 RepID=A0A1H3FVQ0_9PSEU|nr:succinate dehydrogenase cytochrome b subunit [Amycolatopsis xylanica]SDX95066.1 succinate dehydrogenase / fumarate reductase cytochrome b subunit [Amycolatopsis xylanica]
MPSTLVRAQSLRSLWKTTIGKKAVMAVSGLLMVAFLLLHMLGNLKVFFGAVEFDGYAAWLRTIGEPVLHHSWFLWIQRVVLVTAVAAHATAAAQLSLRDRRARPIGYAHKQRARANYATRTMRYGGIILALFIVWHLLDLTVGAVHPGFDPNSPYYNIVKDFQVWWVNLIYIVAVVLVGIHINHGFWSAAQTLGFTRPARARAIKTIGSTLAVVITAGFTVVPVGVMTGVVK